MENSNANHEDPNPSHVWDQAGTSQQEEFADSASAQGGGSYNRHASTAQQEYHAHSSTATSSEAYSSEPGPSNMQVYTHTQYTATQYPEAVRVQFSAPYHSQVGPSSAQDLYQPTQSYERISPVEEYRDVSSGSDALPSYSMQADNAQLIAAPTVDTTGIHHSVHGYPVQQLMVDADNRVVTVQRIISPDEQTVSQSSMAVRREIANPSQASLIAVIPTHSPGNFHALPSQSTSMPKTTLGIIESSSHAAHASLVSFPSTSEVSTTAGSPSMHPNHVDHGGDGDTDQTVSSISNVFTSSDMMEAVPQKRTHRSDSTSGEPDTTQGDADDFPRHRVHHSGHLAEESDETGLLHSTVVGSTVNTTDDVMDMSLDTSHLSQESVGSSGLTSSSDSAIDSGLDRTVDSSSVGHHHQMSPPPYSAHHVTPSDTRLHVSHPHVSQSGLLLTPSGHVTATLNLAPNQMTNISGYTVSNLQYANFTMGQHQQATTSGQMGYFVPVDIQNVQPGTSTITSNGHLILTDENKENLDNDQRKVRKSDRIALMEADTYQRRPHQYLAKPYNHDEIWCEECLMSYPGECPLHKLIPVPDKLVLSRAWSSLPNILQIFRFGDSPELGVFAKRPIQKQTQFGPFIAELYDNREVINTRFLLRLEKEGGEYGYFNTRDENLCNWMMFVRPAEHYAEQNLVAYQHGYDIFFTVTKNIEPKQELKVWYAAHYADRLGVSTHTVQQEDLEGDPDSKWPCYECPKKFRTSAQLQNHLVEHEEGGAEADQEEEYDSNGLKKPKRKLATVPAIGVPKKRGRPSKTLKENGEREPKVFQNWKKRTTNLYLAKTLKKYQKRHDPEMIKRTLKSMYKRKGKDTGGNEWVCTHCDLTFDNSSLLNLHTLTHAAEDVGLEETEKTVSISTGVDGELIITGNMIEGEGEVNGNGNMASIQTSPPACPVCHKEFNCKRDLIEHASEHAMARKTCARANKCSLCWKCFSTHERLQKHMLCHGDEETKPLQCSVCFKRFMNNSALSCHMKTHSNKKFHECPICHMGFDQSIVLKDHVKIHEENGVYVCPVCRKQFEDFILIKKHIRGFHSEKQYPCTDCGKIFPRSDKLKLHMLKHSAHRDFMCETCGRQFKRKDKLKEHMKRMHSIEREQRIREKSEKRPSLKRFIPKVSPTDYHRFIYKCHSCLLGFKRRGMLVNHLAKRHPDIKPDQVPELNLPILKTQRDYYCQYCDKVYKSSSKRKAHIIKNHPGADLPLSSRTKTMIPEIPGLPNPTYSQTVGSITTMPHSCDFCHKQYASKAKLMQHQRKKHSDFVPAVVERRVKGELTESENEGLVEEVKTQEIHVYETVQAAALAQATSDIPTADLLTQAMSELTQSLSEYRTPTGESYRITPGTHTTLVQAAAHIPIQHSTIELSHLGQALGHTQYTTQGLSAVQAAASPGQPQAPAAVPVTIQTIPVSAVNPQSVSPQTVAVSAGTTIQVPVSTIGTVQGQTAYLQRTWTNYPNYR